MFVDEWANIYNLNNASHYPNVNEFNIIRPCFQMRLHYGVSDIPSNDRFAEHMDVQINLRLMRLMNIKHFALEFVIFGMTSSTSDAHIWYIR